MYNSNKLKNTTFALLVTIISLVVYIESSVPYMYAGHKAVPGNKFLGQVIYTPDQDMYFSFVRQAHDGRFVFNNRLTYIPNKPAFVNLEFWLIGTIQHITGISENAVYYVWRYLGILLLTIGVTLLARILLPATGKVLACSLMLMFTGGFGFIFALLSNLHIISLDVAHSGMLDMRSGYLPFQQSLTNPHFSFPHGLILIAYALYIIGEQQNKTRYYTLSGLAFIIIGFVRPYDIILPFLIFPLNALITNGSFKFSIRQLAKKFLPLFMVAPVVLYNIWLFKMNAAFKDWSTQGLNADSLPALPWHYLSYGIAGILAIIRLAQFRRHPLGKTGKFLLVWFLATFMVIHLGKYFPLIGWSPQIGIYLGVPLALLGCSVHYTVHGHKLRYCAAIAVIITCVIAGNLSTLFYYTKNFSDPEKTSIFYAGNDEVAAWAWLNANTNPADVVLAMPATSLRIAKYTGARVVAAHYSVTPRYAETASLVNSIFTDTLLGGIQTAVLKEKLNVTYVYIGPAERIAGNKGVAPDAGFTQVYSNPSVTIYKVN